MPTLTPATPGALRKSDVREANERLVLNIIRQTPEISRAGIVRTTGFSPSTVTFIVNRMMRDELVYEVESQGPPQVGRRPVALRLRPEAKIVVGVEISPHQARIVTADLDGNILARRVARRQADHHHFLARIRAAIQTLTEGISGGRLLGIGVSLPGTIDRATGRVIAAENLGWFDVEAGRILSEGVAANFYFENDAKLGALAERWFCEPGSKPLENFVFVVMRQGLGTGVMIEGRLFHGASGEASEFGHTSLYADGRRCVCGNIGCWEEYASERALERLYAEQRGSGNGAGRQGAAEILRMARKGDPFALAALREMARCVGIGFANLDAAFNPEAIVISGYLATGWDLVEEWVWEALRSRAPRHRIGNLRIIPARHGADSQLMGTVALALDRFFTQPGDGNANSAPPRSVQA